jgi:hypothetical protein
MYSGPSTAGVQNVWVIKNYSYATISIMLNINMQQLSFESGILSTMLS